MVIRKDAALSISIFGVTGSIGQNTCDVLRDVATPFSVKAVSANRNVKALAEQAIKLQAECAVIGDESLFEQLKSALSDTSIIPMSGESGLEDAAALPSDWVMAAITGIAGIIPIITAIRRGASIALANKESLVCAGEWLMQEAKRHHATIAPVDSEHNAVYQVLGSRPLDDVATITLTASGGPFRNTPLEMLPAITPEQAVKHPNWSMGKKISVDSATMMNKGLELIEAYYLFPVKSSQLDAVIHPQSIVHALVSYKDGSMISQMGQPDMRLPIAYALSAPDRWELPYNNVAPATLGALEFEPIDDQRFPCFSLAKEAMEYGGLAPLVLNIANEIAVEAFLSREIRFTDIAKVNTEALQKSGLISNMPLSSVEDLRRCTQTIADETKTLLKQVA